MTRRLVYWLLLTLLVANGLIYFWPLPDTSQSAPSPARQLPTLVLLSEVEEVVVPEPDPVAAGAAPASQPLLLAELQPIAITAERLSVPASMVVELLPLSCWYVGPVDQEEAQTRLLAALEAQGLELNLVLRNMEAEPDYWVHLASGVMSPQELGRELRGKGVDNFPIPEGQLAGNLSLGLFRSQTRAQAVRESVRDMGYPAEIFERPRSREEAWAALNSREIVQLGWPLESGPIPLHPSLQLQPRDCPQL
jgi:hypothetical protein